MLGQIPRVAIGGYLKLLRLPLDGAIRLLPGDGTGAEPAARLAVDRADATLRVLIGTVFGDRVMREDGQRRHEAARERERAVQLRAEAERTSENADARMEKTHAQATRQRRNADRRAKGRREHATRARAEKIERAATSERNRLDDTRQSAARAQEAAEERASRDRLDALEQRADALDEREDALTVQDEASRLADAAARVKEERKSE